MSAAISIAIKDLSFNYGGRSILDDITLQITAGKLTSIIGPNGVGKSTLFKCILGIIKDYKGSITVDKKNIKTMKVKELAAHIAYVPQTHYTTFHYSVLDMVLMGMTAQLSFGEAPQNKHILFAKSCLQKVGIEALAGRDYTQLSGGEQQLVLIARALAQDSKILILDEPTSNMDYGNQLRVMQQIKRLVEIGYTVIQSTHNPDQAFMFSDEVIALKAGKVMASGPPQKVMTTNLINSLYHTDIILESIYNDRLRICIPKKIVEGN